MTLKNFYDNHKNFACRNLLEYKLSPGIKCKFDLIWDKLGRQEDFFNALDLGCSGNSILHIFNKSKHNSYLDLALKPLGHYKTKKKSHPICGDLANLPYRSNTFDLVSALDVLEHIADDEKAIKEIKRVMKEDGISVISVPHRKKKFTQQDNLIGHFRRYEVTDLKESCRRNGMKLLKVFGVYGLIMKISVIQARYPDKTEENLIRLRDLYIKSVSFRVFWTLIVKLISKLMKVEAKYQSIKNIMNIGVIIKK
ncbi:MAG: class I SAM-dependent methyltransferase [Promethearchaeota archaeon]|nr:MAG: class I SAM-dependent methyltransferase [Candidatus Lokiarchaeota archaeon]